MKVAHYQEEKSNFAEACDALKAMLRPRGPINSWCALCGSRELHFEEGTSGYKTLEEAAPWIGLTVAMNAETRAEIERKGMTFEKRRKN